jgi:hypothetical protein
MRGRGARPRSGIRAQPAAKNLFLIVALHRYFDRYFECIGYFEYIVSILRRTDDLASKRGHPIGGRCVGVARVLPA